MGSKELVEKDICPYGARLKMYVAKEQNETRWTGQELK